MGNSTRSCSNTALTHSKLREKLTCESLAFQAGIRRSEKAIELISPWSPPNKSEANLKEAEKQMINYNGSCNPIMNRSITDPFKMIAALGPCPLQRVFWGAKRCNLKPGAPKLLLQQKALASVSDRPSLKRPVQRQAGGRAPRPGPGWCSHRQDTPHHGAYSRTP